jgi:hypothetical protein
MLGIKTIDAENLHGKAVPIAHRACADLGGATEA